MSGVRSLGYWSRETSHYLSHYRNNDGISEDEIIEVSSGNGIRGNRYLETSHSSSCNHGVYYSCDNGIGGSMSKYTIRSFSCNSGVYHSGVGGKCGTRSQDTSHY